MRLSNSKNLNNKFKNNNNDSFSLVNKLVAVAVSFNNISINSTVS